jgi:hypothetical protein
MSFGLKIHMLSGNHGRCTHETYVAKLFTIRESRKFIQISSGKQNRRKKAFVFVTMTVNRGNLENWKWDAFMHARRTIKSAETSWC